MTIGERIKQRRTELGLSVDELATKLGKNRATIYRYESNDIEKLPTTVLEPLSNALGVTPGYLMGWDDSAPPQTEQVTLSKLENKKIRMIPLYQTVSAGFGTYADNMVIGYEPVYIESDYEAENTIAIVVQGDSMYPKIENGDIVVVLKQNYFENGDIIVAIPLNGEDNGYVKRAFEYTDKLVLESINASYPPMEFRGEEMNNICIVGVVKKIIKSI
jgi:repressor LexA